MKPIYFPFTYVPDSIAQALRACFGQFIVYQPLTGKIPDLMKPWVEKDILDVRVPVIEDQKELETVVKNYLSWADLHFQGSGLKPSFARNLKDAVPFFSSSSSSQVMADIKQHVHGKSTSESPDPTMAARIFLYFAQEFDRQNYEVARDLSRYGEKEAELIQELKMENDSPSAGFQKKETQMPDDSAGYMVWDRLEAWTRILLKDVDVSGIFITSIPTLFQELLDKTPAAEKLFHFGSIPSGSEITAAHAAWQQQLVSDLSHIVEHGRTTVTDGPDDRTDFPVAENTIALTVYFVPDQIPRDFFSRCVRIEISDSDTRYSVGSLKNTLIGLIEKK